ncbi:MAG: glucose-1-phosphate adenylyltransferase [Acidimicrobiia bacterium]|nr:glucose-1-phosphate adenylyltransferase [Acidimicrobiia bacterium]
MTVGRSKIISMVLAGGVGARLMPLTRDRAKPAVPFGGQYRLIDFALSNLVNGGYRRILVLTQYKSDSLNRHLSLTWRLSPLLGNYVTSVPAQMRVGERWFLGSADAVFQNLNILHDEKPEHVFVFGADHIYGMDPSQMLEQHIDTKAGVTVAAIRAPIDQADQFGVIERGATTQIEAFREKPKDAKPVPDDPSAILASMGNYIFEAEFLYDLVKADAEMDDSKHDIGGNLIPASVGAGRAHVYDFADNRVPGSSDRDRGYWRDVGTIDAYFDAHMDLVQPEPVFNLYNREWPVYTASQNAPPAKIVTELGKVAIVENSMLSAGAIVSGSNVNESVLSRRVHVEGGSTIEKSIFLDDVRIGAGSVIRNAIIDKNVVVPPGTTIGVDLERDLARFDVSAGGVVTIGKQDVITEPN